MKPGINTSEFYVTIVSALLALLVAYGVFTKQDAEAWLNLATAVIPLLLGLTYTWSRTRVKTSQWLNDK